MSDRGHNTKLCIYHCVACQSALIDLGSSLVNLFVGNLAHLDTYPGATSAADLVSAAVDAVLLADQNSSGHHLQQGPAM